MRVSKLGKVLLLVYPTQYDVASAFVRPQEHYESPEWRGKIFTLGQFRQWYADRFGEWSYYKDWSGFNIPVKVLAPFSEGLFDPVTPQEFDLLKAVEAAGPEVEYVIATWEGCDADTIPHEISHAMWATIPEYKNECLNALKAYDLKEVENHLRGMGYGENVIADECHAYIGESYEALREFKIPFPEALREILQKIKKLYAQSEAEVPSVISIANPTSGEVRFIPKGASIPEGFFTNWYTDGERVRIKA